MNDGKDIARWIMEGEAADGEEIRRVIEITLILHEADIMEQQQRGDHG